MEDGLPTLVAIKDIKLPERATRLPNRQPLLKILDVWKMMQPKAHKMLKIVPKPMDGLPSQPVLERCGILPQRSE
jgi:hypothetical protein